MPYRTCYICEKPSLAREVAGALAEVNGVAQQKGDGCITVGEDVVTWFFGHMFELAQPKAYGDRWARFGDIHSLPIIVGDDEWKMVVPDDKKSQVSIVRALCRQSKTVVNAGDAGREGQLLIDEALVEFDRDPFGPDVLRLWCQSVTRKDLVEAIRLARPNRDKQGLYQAALARSRADYQHGMTFSRLYTILASRSGADVTISVGRVQTPTLRLVVDRDRERANFKPVNHYLPQVTFQHAEGSFAANWDIPADYDGLDPEGRLVDRAVAAAVADRVDGQSGTISEFKAEAKVEMPPLPHSLETMQSACSRKLGLTAKQTLEVLQALYEKKVTSYPRTDSQYLPETLLTEEAPGIMAVLGTMEPYATLLPRASMEMRSAAWNTAKCSDHYAIIPTSEVTAAKVASLSDVERAVFDIAARGLISQFFPGFRFRALSVKVAVGTDGFSARGRAIQDEGWRVVFGSQDESEDEDEAAPPSLPMMQRGDKVRAVGSKLIDKRTTPPQAFNDDRLIKAMANAHLFETNAEIRKRLKEGDGIGRPATRADIIENLIKRTFLVRKGKVGLESSPLGRSVVDALPEELKSVGMTALWEGAMARIEGGELTCSQFLASQAADITRRVQSARGGSVTVQGVKAMKPLPGHGEPCTACADGVMYTKELKSKKDGKVYKALCCSNYPTCNRTVFVDDVAPLPGHGKPCEKCGKGQMNTRMLSKKDGTKEAVLACSAYPECRNIEFSDTGKPRGPRPGDLPDIAGTGKTCPQCSKGKLVTRTFTSKKDGKPFAMLKCDTWPKCDYGEYAPKTSDKKSA